MLQSTTEGNSMVRMYGMHYLKPGGGLRVDQGYGGKHSGPQQHCQAAELWRQSCQVRLKLLSASLIDQQHPSPLAQVYAMI